MNNLRKINPEQLAMLLRTVLQVLGGVMMAKGWISEGDWTLYSGAALTIIITIWGVWARNDTNLIASAAEVPAVEKVVTQTVAVARKVASDKVKPG